MTRPLGEYELGAALGAGGMGEVFAARHRGSGLDVAVKVLTAEGAREWSFGAALELELRAVALLDHPNIVQLLDFGTVPPGHDLAEGSPYLVLERIHGGPLRAAETTWEGTRRQLLAILDGLAHAHARGLIHRDLKPGNLLVRRGTPVLADFGLAALRADHRVLEQAAGAWPSARARGGTPNYIAPEQVRGALRDQGPWTDLYALGCVAWTLITGAPPFAALERPDDTMHAHVHTPPPALDPEIQVPTGLEAWLRGLLAKNPSSRPACAGVARAALLALDDGPVRWRVPTPPADWRPERGEEPRPDGRAAGLCLLRPPRLVGREAVRDRLWAELRGVHESGQPRMVLLRGSSGVGKSRLADWLAERAEELGVASVFRAHHQEIPGPHDGLGPMLDRSLQTTDVSLLVLAEDLQRRLALAPDAAAELAEVLRGPVDPLLPILQTDRARWEQVAGVLARSPGMAVLVVDDLQWAPGALDCCEHLLRRPGRTLIVATVRDEDIGERMERLDALGAHDAVVELPIAPLDQGEGRRLLDELLPLEPELAAQLHDRCAGNALFQVQLVGDWVRRGLLRPGPGGLRAAPGAARTMPAELAAMWRGRVDALLAEIGLEHERPLELAAALGLEVAEEEWVALVDPERAGTVARALLDRGLAHAWSVGRWSWAHAMVREAVLERAGGRRPELHRACAALLADAPARSAPHLVAAGRFREGARVYRELARQLRTSGSSAELVHAASRALAALDAGQVPPDDPLWPELRVRVGMEQLNRYRLPYVDEQLAAARPHLDRPTWRPYRASFYVMEAWLAGRRGETEAIHAAIDGALEAFPDSDQRTSVAATVSYYLRRVGRIDDALALLDELLPATSLDVADRSLGMVAQVRGTLELGRGEHDLARRYLEYGLARGQEIGDARVTLACRGALGSLARAQGDFDGAAEHYAATLVEEARLGVPHHITEANIAVLDVVRGRPRAAAARFETLLATPGLPAVLEIGAWLGVLLGWLDEGGEGAPPVVVDELVARLARAGSEPELALLVRHAVDAARAAGHEDLAQRLTS